MTTPGKPRVDTLRAYVHEAQWHHLDSGEPTQPEDEAEAVVAAVATWLREQAQANHTWQSSTDPLSVREVLEWLAESVERGEA